MNNIKAPLIPKKLPDPNNWKLWICLLVVFIMIELIFVIFYKFRDSNLIESIYLAIIIMLTEFDPTS